MKRARKLLARLRESLQQALRPDANSMVLRQTHVWSRAIIWTIAALFVFAVIWACLAPMDEVIHATGKLEPRGSVREVQSPVPGVIAEVLVKEGERVSTGQVLLRLDPKVAAAQLRALEDQLASMRAEQAFYEQLFRRGATPVAPVTLPPEILDLAKNHASLLAEDSLLRAIIDSSEDGFALNEDQKKLFTEEQKDLVENYNRITSELKQARLIRDNNKEVLESYRRLLASGAGSRVDFLARESTWFESVGKVNSLENQQRNTITGFRKDAMLRLGENTKRIAEIEADLTKARVDVSQRISDTNGRVEAAREDLSYHEIKAPSEGIVFQILFSKPGNVIAAKDTVMKIVPSDELIAKVDITNKDIGFIRIDLPCEVEVDTFPKREFGFIEGTVFFVGSDALPPDEVRRNYSFPAKISLQRQHLDIRGKEVPLQSGMSVSANIKVRKRKVINFFIDTLLGPLEKMEELR